MKTTRQSTGRGFSLWHIFVFVIVVFGILMIAGALADGLYLLAGITFVVIGGGLPVAARMRKLRGSLRGGDDRQERA